MSKILNKAKLLLNPGGSSISYKEDKIYSVFPNDGSGDFTYVGGDGGTRINQDGYIERTPYNLAPNSNGFTWNYYQAIPTAGATTGPFGQEDGVELEIQGSGEKYQRINSFTAVEGETYTFSVFAKYNQVADIGIRTVFANGNGDQTTFFNLENGAVIQQGASHFNPGSKYVGNGWYRFYVSYTSPAPPAFNLLVRAQITNGSSISWTASSGDSLYVYGGQTNIGALRPYQPTTNRLDYPNVTYKNGVGLISNEPERTNRLLHSNNFPAYIKQNLTLTPNAEISPDGTMNATKWETSNATNHQLYQQGIATTGRLNFSCHAKQGEFCKTFYLAIYPNGYAVYWDIETGEILSVVGSGVQALPGEKMKDGWWRFSMNFTDINQEIQIGFLSSAYTGTSPNAWAISTSTDVSGYIYGAQMENTSEAYSLYPTSYIPTTTATVTRPRSYSTANFPALSGEGTLYLNFYEQGNKNFASEIYGTNVGSLYLSENNNYIPNAVGVSRGSLSGWGIRHYSASVLASMGIDTTSSIGPKTAIAFSGSSLDFFNNGVKTAGSTGFNLFGNYDVLSFNELSNRPTTINLSTIAVFDEKLSYAELEELTTIKSATGGNITNHGPYTIHTFTSSGTFTPSFSGEVEVLVVAGGGAGGAGGSNVSGAGGGAGGLMYNSSIPVTSGTNYTIVVGAGGAGTTPTSDAVGDPGTPSSAFGLNTTGGGGGEGNGAANNIKQRGGSGGGGRESNGTGGTTIDNQQGNIGGDGSEAGNYAGGGGGASQPGNTNGLGYGGDGLLYSISGYPTYYAGGGSSIGPPGGTESAEPGLGGGGKGRHGRGGDDGVANTGGGGGGTQSAYSSGHGGSGIVIVRYLR